MIKLSENAFFEMITEFVNTLAVGGDTSQFGCEIMTFEELHFETMKELSVFIPVFNKDIKIQLEKLLEDVDKQNQFFAVALYTHHAASEILKTLKNYYLAVNFYRTQPFLVDNEQNDNNTFKIKVDNFTDGDFNQILELWNNNYYKEFIEEFGKSDLLGYVKKVNPTLDHIMVFKNKKIVADLGVRSGENNPPQNLVRAVKSDIVTYYTDTQLDKSERRQIHRILQNFLNKYEVPIKVSALKANTRGCNFYKKIGFKETSYVYIKRG